jgi:hypothetical protein
MAKVILNPNEERTLYNINDDIYGARGTEVVTVAATTTAVKMDQNVERVVLEGHIADFQFLQSGNNLKVYSGPNTVVATILVQDDGNGTQITFSDGTVNAMFNKAGAAPVIQLGDATVSGSSAGHVTVSSAFIDHDLITPPSGGGHIFTLHETTETVTTPNPGVLTWEGLPVDSHSIEQFLFSIASVDFAELGKNMNDITAVKDINFNNQNGTATISFNLADGTTIDVNSKVGLEYLAFIKDLIFDEQGNPRLEITHSADTTTEIPTTIMLTPTANNGGTFESGYTTDGDDLIVAGRPELLHGAYIDAGGGYNTLEVDMKGVFAQPVALLNIQEIHVEDLPNIYTDAEGHSTYPNLSNTAGDYTGSALDLSRAIDLQKLVITQGSGIGNVELGDLTIVGIRNGATARLEGGFSKEVSLQYGEGIKADGVHLELNLGTTDYFKLNVAQNSSTMNINSMGTENMLEQGFFGGDLRYLNITGHGSFYVEKDLGDSFEAGRPATIDASGNTGGVDLNISGHQVVEFKGSSGDDTFRADGSIDLFAMQGEGLDLDGLNPFHTVKFLTITGGSGDNNYETSLFENATITSGGGNDTITAVLGINATIDAGGGNNTITVSAQNIKIVTGGGNDTITVAGLDLDHLMANYYDPNHVIDGFAAGAVLKIDAGGGANTIILSNAISELLPSYISDILPDLPIGLVALEGSRIAGDDITLKVDTDSNLSAATLSGITSVVLDADLTLTADQAESLGAGAFTTVHPETTSHTEELHIVVDHDVTLGDILDLSALDASVKLAFTIKEGATLTLTAEQLHDFVAPDGINVETGMQNGKVILTDAGLNFDPFHDNGADNIANGTITPEFANSDDLTIIRTVDGFERPVPGPSTDTLIINSDLTPVINAPEGATHLESLLTTLKIIGSADLTFNTPIKLGAGFTVDYSELQGHLNGLTLMDFQNVKEMIGDDTTTGNFTRVNIELSGNVGAPGLANGVVSSGVSEYVVTNLNGGDRTFYTCDNTHDLKVLGLQGNSGHSITFEGVPWGHVSPSFLLEGDGYADFNGGSKADADPNESNIGTLHANFFYPGAPAVVNITNQGVPLGVTSTGEPRPLVVDGIDLINAASVTINVSDGNAEIRTFDGNQQLKDVILTSAYDVTLHVDANENSLESINADAVTGTAALVIDSTYGAVDLAHMTLDSIDKIVLTDHSELALSATEINDINLANIVVEHVGDTAVLDVEGLRSGPFDVNCLTEGVSIGFVTIADMTGHADNSITLNAATDLTGALFVYVPDGTVLNMTGAQFQELAGAGTITGPGEVNITGITQADIDNGLDLSGVQHAGTITFSGDVVLEPTTNLGDFAIDLTAGQTLTMTDFYQANDRTVHGTESIVVLEFSQMPVGVDHIAMGEYYVAEVHVLDDLVENVNNNVEDLLNYLDDSAKVVIVDVMGSPIDVTAIHRIAFVDAGVTVESDVIFDNLHPTAEVRTLDLTLKGDAHITGDLDLTTQHPVAPLVPHYLEKLTITSTGTGANSINGDILGGVDGTANENNMLNVEIKGDQAFSAHDLVFTSLTANATATLTVNDSANVTLAEIVATDTDITTVNIVNNGAGTLTVTGASPALDLYGDETVNLSGSGNMVFGTAGDASKPSISDATLTTLNAADLTGDLNLNVIADVSSTKFTFTSGSGETDLIVADTLNAPAGGVTPAWTFDMTKAAAGSELTFTDVTAFTNGGTLNVLSTGDNVLVTAQDVHINNQALVNQLEAVTFLDVIDMTTNGAVQLDQTSALADIKLSANGTVTVADAAVDTQAEIDALLTATNTQHQHYIDMIDLGTTAVQMDANFALTEANGHIENGDVTVTGVADQATLDALAALGWVDHVMVSQQLALAGPPTGSITSYEVGDVTITTAAQVTALQNLTYVTAIDLTDAGAVTLNELQALADTKLTDSGTVTVVDSGITSEAQVIKLQQLDYVDKIDLTTNGAVTVSAATFELDKLLPNGTVTVADTGAEIAKMTLTQFGSDSLDIIDATDNQLTLSADQYNAIQPGGKTMIATNDAITINSDGGPDIFNFNAVGGGAITLSFADATTYGDTVTNFNAATDIIKIPGLTAGSESVQKLADVTGDFAAANVFQIGGVTNIDVAAQKIAADTDVTAQAGVIIISDGSNTFVYASDNLADNGHETLVVELVGVSDPLTLPFFVVDTL